MGDFESKRVLFVLVGSFGNGVANYALRTLRLDGLKTSREGSFLHSEAGFAGHYLSVVKVVESPLVGLKKKESLPERFAFLLAPLTDPGAVRGIL